MRPSMRAAALGKLSELEYLRWRSVVREIPGVERSRARRPYCRTPSVRALTIVGRVTRLCPPTQTDLNLPSAVFCRAHRTDRPRFSPFRGAKKRPCRRDRLLSASIRYCPRLCRASAFSCCRRGRYTEITPITKHWPSYPQAILGRRLVMIVVLET